jgi:hypothetical protein
MTRLFSGVCICICCLAACAQSTTPPPNVPQATVPAAQPHSSGQLLSVRLIVQFKSTAVTPKDLWVGKLQTQTGAGVQHVSSGSPGTHVYLLTLAPGQTEAQIQEQLRAMPEVQMIETDQRARLH